VNRGRQSALSLLRLFCKFSASESRIFSRSQEPVGSDCSRSPSAPSA
jgi:hypothetical protein